MSDARPPDKDSPPAAEAAAAAPPPPSPGAWRPLDMSGLRGRLAEVKSLLEQAAALAAAHDTSRLETMAAHMQKNEEQARGGAVRRRYR